MSESTWRVPDYRKPLTVQRFWSPDVAGESIAGVFIGVRDEDGAFGRETLLCLRVDGAEKIVRVKWSLDKQLCALKPQRGHGIAIRFEGRDMPGVKRGPVYTVKLWPKLDDASLLSGSELRADEAFGDVPKPGDDAPKPGDDAPKPGDDEFPF